MQKFVRETFELPAHVTVHSSTTSRHNEFACSSLGDIVLIRSEDGSLAAGIVKAHVAAEGEPLTFIQQLTLQAFDRAQGTAIWDILDHHDFIKALCALRQPKLENDR